MGVVIIIRLGFFGTDFVKVDAAHGDVFGGVAGPGGVGVDVFFYVRRGTAAVAGEDVAGGVDVGEGIEEGDGCEMVFVLWGVGGGGAGAVHGVEDDFELGAGVGADGVCDGGPGGGVFARVEVEGEEEFDGGCGVERKEREEEGEEASGFHCWRVVGMVVLGVGR